MMFGYWSLGGMMWFWVIMIFGCGSWFFGFRPRRYWRYRSHRPYRHMRQDNPLNIASARLVRGEISFEEYERIKKALLDS